MLIGNLGHSPKVKYLPNGDCIANFSIATGKSWTDKATGEKKTETQWHRVVLFQRLAEVASEYLKGGSKVYVEGTLKTRKYTDKTGCDRWTTEVYAQGLQMLGDSKSDVESTAETLDASPPEHTKKEYQAAQDPGNMTDFDDDVPF